MKHHRNKNNFVCFLPSEHKAGNKRDVWAHRIWPFLLLTCSFKIWGCIFDLGFCLFVWILSTEANRAFVKYKYILKNHNKMEENHNNYKDWVKVRDGVGQIHHPDLLCSFPVVQSQQFRLQLGTSQSCLLDCLSSWFSLFLEFPSPFHEEIIYRQTLRLHIKCKVGFDPLLDWSNRTEDFKPPNFLRFVLQCHF